MAETPSMKRILEVYYALLAQGVQRFPRQLAPSGHSAGERNRCLFLIDFAPELVELGLTTGGVTSAPPIICRLLERLPWSEQVLPAVIFKQVPKAPQLHPIDEAGIAVVREALQSWGADRCVCFGWRAAHVLGVALGVPFALPTEAYEPIACDGDEGKKLEILVLPEVRELDAIPEWRAKVWESLLAFGPVR